MSGDGGTPPVANPSGRSSTRVAGPSRSGATVHVKYRKKITQIQLTKLTYKSDHHLMLDNHVDWLPTGSLYTKPEWTIGTSCNPVSHSMNQVITLDLEFDVQPPDADPDIGDIIGKAPLKTPDSTTLYYTFAATYQKFKGGTVQVTATLRTVAPDHVIRLTGDIAWSVTTRENGSFDAGSSTGHDHFITMSTPVNAPTREAGITQRRMRMSVTRVAEANSNDPHAIAKYLQNRFHGYTLKTDPAVPAKYNHPQYFAHQGQTESGAGAWPAIEFVDQTAECQAIIRWVRAVMLQVGCPGTMSVVVVWADPSDGKVKEGDWDAGVGGLVSVQKTVNGKVWQATLADDNVEEGDVIEYGSVGFNNFEACLKLTYGGKTMYYGGGAGDYETKEKVITAFTALIWYSWVTTSDAKRMVRIEKVVKTYD
jgi:hypothetical protein